MDRTFICLGVMDSKSGAVELFRKYDRTALPVTNDDHILVGIVTVDDVLDVVEEQATKEMQRLGGVEALEEPYIETRRCWSWCASGPPGWWCCSWASCSPPPPWATTTSSCIAP
jgi:Mg/Co/Ni transporter MgtE